MNMNRLLFLLILCALAVPQIATASDHALEDALNLALNHQFKDKILILRHPLGDESLHFDAQGNILHQGREGAWTVYGAVQIQKVELSRNKLRLRGKRLGVRSGVNGLAPLEFTRPKNPLQT